MFFFSPFSPSFCTRHKGFFFFHFVFLARLKTVFQKGYKTRGQTRFRGWWVRYVHERDEDGHVVRFVVAPRPSRPCFCRRRFPSHVHTHTKTGNGLEKGRLLLREQQQRRKRKTRSTAAAVSTEEDHVMLRRSSKERSPEVATSIRICVLPWSSGGLRDPSPGMSPIAVRHFEHGSEASTRFTCALAYVYICICIPSSQRTTKTLCARAG